MKRKPVSDEVKLRIKYIELMQAARLEGESILSLHVRVFGYYVAEQERINSQGGKFQRSTRSA